MPVRQCVETRCRQLAEPGTSRCQDHTVEWKGDPARQQHYGGDWPKVSKAARAAWIAERGYVCPGWGVPPHPSHDLTADHILKASEGGTPTRENVRILCRGCNTRRAVTEMNESRRAHVQ